MDTSISNITPLKIGFRFKPPAIIFVYEDTFHNYRKRTMPVRGLFKNSPVARIAQELKERHGVYLEQIPVLKIQKLLRMIQENMKGNSLDESLSIINKEFSIDPDEDLNKLDDESLKHKKAIMDLTFEVNRKKPDDPDFQYDVQVDFPELAEMETAHWDSEKDEDVEF